MMTKIKKLGSGTYADVFHVLKNGKNYALKVNFSNEVSFCNCLREIHAMKKIEKHPFILIPEDFIFEYRKENNYVDFLYQLADGELKIKNFKIESLGKIIVELMLGVEFMHSRNIIHRDIKPHNVLLFGDDIKITDFGISCDTNLDYLKDVAYTPGFRAPEVCLKENYDFKADIWALGALIFYIVYGEYYIKKIGEDNVQLLEEIKQREHSYLTNHKRPDNERAKNVAKILNLDVLDRILRNMLHTDKAERLSITDILFDKSFSPFFENYRDLINDTRKKYRPYTFPLDFNVHITIDSERCQFINEMTQIVDEYSLKKITKLNIKFMALSIYDKCRNKIDLSKKILRKTIVFISLKFCIDDLFFEHSTVIGKYSRQKIAEAEKTIIFDGLNGVILDENIFTLSNRYFIEPLNKLELLFKFYTKTGFNGEISEYFSTAIKMVRLVNRRPGKTIYCNKR